MRTRPDTVPRRIKRPGMFAGGDGSTLSLDFTTMSSLDSRFTFSRSSTATFINSSGLVRYADHNLVQNSAFVGPNSGTGWVQNGGGTFTNSGTGSITTAVIASNQAYVSRTFVTKQGLRYSASVNVTSISGTINYNQVLAVAGSISADTFYRNGSVVNASTTAQTGLLTIIFTAGAGGTNTFRSGVGASGTNQTNVTVVFDSVRAVEGENTQPTYFVSPSGSEYQAPRFDYDPSTLALRGLLIEGSATNIVTYSDAFANAIWQVDNSGAANPSVSTVSQSGPDGASTVTRITFNKTGGTFSRIRQTLTGTASTAYTMSVWMKANTASGGASTQNVGIRIGADPAGFNCVVTTTWKRFQYTYTLSGTDAAAQIMLWDNIVGNDETADVLVYGCQIELGSGASSYIPTGASTVQRAADSCHITPLTPWFNATEGTVLHESAVLFPASGFTRVYGFVQQTSTPLGVNTDSISLGLQGSTGQLFLNVREASTDRVNLFVPAGGAITSGTFHKVAVCYKRGDYRISRAGFSATDAYNATFPAGLQSLGFNNISANWPAVWFKSVKYFPTRLPNAQMDAWSA